MSPSIASAVLRRTLCYHSSRRLFSSSVASSLRTRCALIPRTLNGKASSLIAVRSASTTALKADDDLKRFLKRGIHLAELDKSEKVAPPEGFPFEINDFTGDQTITLKREFGDECIKAVVFMNLEEPNMEEDSDTNNSKDDENDYDAKPSLSLIVMIDKGEGPTIQFSCSLDAEELTIESLAMKKHDDSDDKAYQGPPFFELDESLQKAWHKYLEVRGINCSLFDFLQEYLTSKEENEYLMWLMDTKKFVEK